MYLSERMEKEMIKLHKNSLLLRGIATLLSAVLIVGMTANVVPMYVLAQEDANPVEESEQDEELEQGLGGGQN